MHRLILFVAIILALSGCHRGSEERRNGSARIAVAAQALSVADVARVTVTVSGDHIDPPLVAELTGGGGDWQGRIDGIPAGEGRTFEARAYDAADTLLYEGRATDVTIVDGEVAIVTIFLQQATPPEPFQNAAPRLLSLVASSNQVAPDGSISLAVEAVDPDDEPLIYAWTATAGSFDSAAAATTVWTAPDASQVGEHTLTITVSDPLDATASAALVVDVQVHYGQGGADVDIELNTSPEVTGLVASRSGIDAGDSVQLDLTAADPDGDPLAFAWSADCEGSFADETVEDPTFTLTTVPSGGEDCAFTVIVTDGRGGSNTGTLALATGPSAEFELCDDGLFCNGIEHYDAVEGCVDGAAPELDDGVACTVDSCDEEADTVVHTADAADCDDGNPGTDEVCDPGSGCQ
ncbi:MAG: hypothetical protein P8099_19900, partial [Gemmatimonadota bacterium]